MANVKTLVRFDRASAERFCRAYAPKGYLSGSGFWATEKWLEKADLLAQGLEPAELARLLKSAGAKAKMLGCTCSKCGRVLTDPESVAAGLGPECMAA